MKPNMTPVKVNLSSKYSVTELEETKESRMTVSFLNNKIAKKEEHKSAISTGFNSKSNNLWVAIIYTADVYTPPKFAKRKSSGYIITINNAPTALGSSTTLPLTIHGENNEDSENAKVQALKQSLHLLESNTLRSVFSFLILLAI